MILSDTPLYNNSTTASAVFCLVLTEIVGLEVVFQSMNNDCIQRHSRSGNQIRADENITPQFPHFLLKSSVKTPYIWLFFCFLKMVFFNNHLIYHNILSSAQLDNVLILMGVATLL